MDLSNYYFLSVGRLSDADFNRVKIKIETKTKILTGEGDLEGLSTLPQKIDFVSKNVLLFRAARNKLLKNVPNGESVEFKDIAEEMENMLGTCLGLLHL